jgi:mono/diheme cytochrome c family protein
MKRAAVSVPLLGVVLAGALTAFGQPPVAAQTTGRQNPPLVIASVYGRDLFEFYCASCHGRDGKGGGPVVPALKTAPPDLTTIAARSGGTFPAARVESFVTGDQVLPAHGTREMPVWGPIFRALDPSDTMARIRIANTVSYVESIQVRP